MIFQRKLSHRNWIAFEYQSVWFECSMFTYAYSVLYVWYHLNEIESQWNHVIRSVSLCFKRNRKNVAYNLNGNRIYVAITDTALECHLCYWMLLMCMNTEQQHTFNANVIKNKRLMYSNSFIALNTRWTSQCIWKNAMR